MKNQNWMDKLEEILKELSSNKQDKKKKHRRNKRMNISKYLNKKERAELYEMREVEKRKKEKIKMEADNFFYNKGLDRLQELREFAKGDPFQKKVLDYVLSKIERKKKFESFKKYFIETAVRVKEARLKAPPPPEKNDVGWEEDKKYKEEFRKYQEKYPETIDPIDNITRAKYSYLLKQFKGT